MCVTFRRTLFEVKIGGVVDSFIEERMRIQMHTYGTGQSLDRVS